MAIIPITKNQFPDYSGLDIGLNCGILDFARTACVFFGASPLYLAVGPHPLEATRHASQDKNILIYLNFIPIYNCKNYNKLR